MTVSGADHAPAAQATELLAAARRLRAAGADDPRVWPLTLEVTGQLAATDNPSPQLLEATAALQRLSLQDADLAPVRRGELAALLGERPPVALLVPDGPIVVLGSPTVTDYLGREVELPPVVALCRCGRSATKPICDGSHAAAGFDDRKADDRVPDRRDTYPGVAMTVLDNRGLCAHSGLCSDRIASVFHAGSEPFVTPSGGRMDEVLLAVRDCPSGALGAAFAEVEARDVVDQPRPPGISISKDGPYRVTGGIAVLEGDGQPVVRNTGASLEHCSLCRCGQSRNKPFCSGMHWYVDFHDPAPPDGPTLFEWAGGYPALLRVTRLFYQKFIPADPLLSALFATMAPDHPERVAAWLGEVFGGPSRYSDTADTYGGPYTRMLGHHLGKMLTEPQRARWLALLAQSADEALLPADPEFRSAFVSYLEWGSRVAVENSQGNSHPPLHMPMPHWDWGTAGPPGSRISAIAPPAESSTPPSLPDADQAPGFDAHIKGLFRASDRASMTWAFDLWSFTDVTAHATEILARLKDGSMPCDGAWDAGRIGVFERWLAAGCPA